MVHFIVLNETSLDINELQYNETHVAKISQFLITVLFFRGEDRDALAPPAHLAHFWHVAASEKLRYVLVKLLDRFIRFFRSRKFLLADLHHYPVIGLN